ncbi:anti-sigma factor family protein [Kribbella sp. CA-294648]|uniref:anti-sigma factor family protein n=1 Tax=Kribbella sp. CA-294648 TaxID=3239948 RepID=UPI003D944C8A
MTESGLPTSEHLEHLDTDTIADLIENLLPAPEAHRAREHVKACPDCQQTYDALVQLTEDLADEGRADIPMPTHVAEHLDAVLVSESVLRASTVGVHSLVQLREEPRRHLPKLVLAAAGVIVVAGIGVGVVIATGDQGKEGVAGINPTVPTDSVPALTSDQVGPNVQRWLENANGPVLHAGQAEVDCARKFATDRSGGALRLVQQAKVDGKRATVIGLQGGSQRDIEVTVVTGCSGVAGVAAPFYETSVTLRKR